MFFYISIKHLIKIKMKKLILLLLFIPHIFSCSSVDNNSREIEVKPQIFSIALQN
jgi:hypothetical protein